MSIMVSVPSDNTVYPLLGRPQDSLINGSEQMLVVVSSFTLFDLLTLIQIQPLLPFVSRLDL